MPDRDRYELEMARLKSRAIDEFARLDGSFPVLRRSLEHHGDVFDYNTLTRAIIERERRLKKRCAHRLKAIRKECHELVMEERRRANGFPPTLTGLFGLMRALLIRKR